MMFENDVMNTMVKKILERLETSRQRDIFGGWDTIRIDKVEEIVQEVAKEYEDCEVMRSNCEVDGGWIPCSERLPKEATCYLITEEVVVNSKKQYVVDIRLFGTEGEWLCPSNRKVIAWQPLPAPYQKGE